MCNSNQSNPTSLLPYGDNFYFFFNAVNECLYVLSMEGTILAVNSTVIKKLGYSENELINQSVLIVHPPKRHKEAMDIVGKMIVGETSVCHIPIQTKSGKEIPAETYVVKGIWNNQPVLFGVSKDLTALKASEEKFSKAFHTNPTPMAITDLKNGQFLEVNSKFLDTTEFEYQEVIGKTARELQLFFDENKRNEIINLTLSCGELHNQEILLRTKTGKILNGLFSITIIQLQDQNLLLTVMIDLTKQRTTEGLLQQEKERYLSLVENIRDWVWELDQDGLIKFSNRHVLEVLGRSSAEVLEKTIFSLMNDTYRDQAINRFTSLKNKTLSFISSEVLFDTKDGGGRFLETRALPIYSSSGIFLGLRGVSRDITEKYKYNIKLINDRYRLENEVEERTKDLSKANKSLKKAILEKKIYIKQVEQHNLTLKSLIESITTRENELLNNVIKKIQSNVFPLISRLSKTKTNPVRLISLIKKEIMQLALGQEEISFSSRFNLSPAEAQVAEMYKSGRIVKEIASELGLSSHTINNHIRHIRKKTGIDRKVNLRTFLKYND